MWFFKKFKFNLVRTVCGFLVFFVVFNFFGLSFCESVYAGNFFDVSAKNGAILIDELTGDVLFEKNADKEAAVASTTKIISTMIVLEKYKEFNMDLDEEFVVDSKAIQVEGSSMGLKPGDVVTMRDLCYGMMLPSGNDAANAAAVRLCGSVEAFVELMNKRARELGLTHTKFQTPSGLDSEPGDDSREVKDISKVPHSTAREMAILTRKAFQNETFKEICSSKKARLNFGVSPKTRTIFNSNKILWRDDENFGKPTGVKTGFTNKAGRCLVASARKSGRELIVVLLNDHDDWNDAQKLLEYGFSKFSKYDLPHDFSKIKPEVLCDNETNLTVDLKKPVKMFLTKNMANSKRVKTKIKIQNFIFAPIYKDEKVGEVEYYLDDMLIKKADLVSCNDVLQ